MVARAPSSASDADSGAASGSGFENSLVGVLSAAIQAHRSGQLAEAEDGYRHALEMAPDHPHALHFLGVIAHQQGNSEEAIALIGRAIERLPDFADAYSNLGAAYHAIGRLHEAEDSFRRAAEFNPDLPEAHNNLASVLISRGKQHEAIESYRRAHAIAPHEPRFIKRLGDLYLEAGQFEDTVEWFERFLDETKRQGPAADDLAEVSNNLGYACEKLGRLERAAEWYRKALAHHPDAPEINNNLANTLSKLNRHDEADAYFAKALAIDPSKWQDLSNLAGTYVNRRDLDRAIGLYEQLIAQQPEDAKLFNDFGVALSAAGRYRDAEEKYRRSTELDPEFAEAYNNLGSNLLRLGRRAESIDLFKKAIEIKPRYMGPHLNISHALAHQRRLDEAYFYAQATLLLEDYQPGHFSNPNKVFRQTCDFDSIVSLGNPWENMAQSPTADYHANFLEMLVVAETADDVDRLAVLHRNWGEDLMRRASERPLPPIAPRPARGRIRIGIMSSDLRDHSVAKFVLPILQNRDGKFEIHCYAPFEEKRDPVQERIREMVAGFRIINNESDRDFAEIVRRDGIDILFDLNGFTRDSRLTVFARRAAPVQIAWLGYPFTTGIPEADYVLLDPFVRPVNDAWFVEKPLLMPESWVCFGSFAPEPISEELPLERNGALTFGSMNNPYKLTREAIALWCRIMERVPGSRFLYVRPELYSMVLRNNLVQEFGRHGIGPERLFFVDNWKTGLAHFSYYDEIDITLDTFPLTGGTTTCDSLWMGVPVVSKYGPSMHQRLSYSIMTNCSLQDLCVETEEAYLETAVALAEDTASLRLLRRELRPALQASPLCQSEKFAAHFYGLMSDVAERHGLR